MSSTLKELKDELAVKLFGMDVEEAHERKVCIMCRQNIDKVVFTDLDKAEYNITALCHYCFKNIIQ